MLLERNFRNTKGRYIVEIRVLRYFLVVAREGSITGASKVLHISQPALCKQLKDLENELGTRLYVRTNYRIRLTEAGRLLRRRSEDILSLTDKTLDEFRTWNDLTGGDIRLGCAESCHIRFLTDALKAFRNDHPGLRIHITSGDTMLTTERLERGLLDFGIIVEPPDLSKYNYVKLPAADTWGLVMLSTDPLAKKEKVRFEDLCGIPLFASPQSIRADFPRWCGEGLDRLHFAGTVNLFYNGSVCVKSGLGCLLTFEYLADVSPESGLCFRPLDPPLRSQLYLIWKKYQVFSPIAELFLRSLSLDK